MGGAIQRHHDNLNSSLKNRAETLAAQAAAKPAWRKAITSAVALCATSSTEPTSF
jgi:hypothetical protein